MPNLMVIGDSLHNCVWWYECLGYASPGDSILLIEDAVGALNNKLLLASFLAKCAAQNSTVYALSEDVHLRGICIQAETIKLVNAEQLPDLVLAHRKQVTW